MKRTLDSIEKERRQEWRNKQYAVTPAPRPHHLTRKQRLEGRVTAPHIVDLRELTANFFAVKEKIAKSVKPRYIKARARKLFANQTVK